MRLFLALALIAAVISCAKVDDECMLATSCGQCIQKGPQCAWCMDPASPLTSRCQKKDKLIESGKCMKENIYQPVTGTESPPNTFRIGDKGHHNLTVMIEPQIVTMKVKMGEPMKAQFKYKHVRPASDPSAVNVQLQHSELPSDYQAKFFIMCKGKRMETKRCDDVPDGQLMDIEVEVTLKDCAKVTGTASFSLGVVGYGGVSGIYINPKCGCECEIVRFHEKASHFCSGAGNLICGQCSCDKDKGGSKCECPLAQYGVKTYKELEDKCREKPGAPICGGNGKCACGKCQCDSIQVSGDFCSCDNTSCPVGGPDARQCSGRGLCKCGKCECEEGFERDDCSCEKSKDKCMENGKECGGNGHCECGKCVCNNGWTGAFCAANEKGVKKVTSDKKESLQKDTIKKEKGDATTKSSAECGDDDECPINQKVEDDEPIEDSQIPECGEECPVDIQGAQIDKPEEEETSAEEQSSSSSIVAFSTVLLPLALARCF